MERCFKSKASSLVCRYSYSLRHNSTFELQPMRQICPVRLNEATAAGARSECFQTTRTWCNTKKVGPLAIHLRVESPKAESGVTTRAPRSKPQESHLNLQAASSFRPFLTAATLHALHHDSHHTKYSACHQRRSQTTRLRGIRDGLKG